MEYLKELFTQPLSFEEFSKAVTEKGFKLADLSKGEYVAKGKLTDLTDRNKILEGQLTSLNTQMQELKNTNATADDYKNKFETLQKEIKENEDKAKAEQADSELTNAITSVFGDKKFTSDYVKNGIVADMKVEISKTENKGKGYAELFESLTKDKEGIFANANPMNMSGVNAAVGNLSVTREQFTKMGIAERTKLYNENQKLYETLQGE